MGYFLKPDAFGTQHSFEITGDEPTADELSRMDRYFADYHKSFGMEDPRETIGFFGDIYNSFWQGKNNTDKAAIHLKLRSGLISPDEAAKQLKEQDEDLARYQSSYTLEKQLQEIKEHPDKWDNLGALLSRPRAIASMFAQSFGTFAPAAIAGAVGGVAGGAIGSFTGPGGAALGAKIGGGAGYAGVMAATDMGVEVEDALIPMMQKRGLDPYDVKDLTKALADKEFMTKVYEKADLRGLPITALDLASVAVGGQLSYMAHKAIKAGKVAQWAARGGGRMAKMAPLATRIAAGAGDVAVQAALGMGGEAWGQTNAGQPLDWTEIWPEGLLEIIPGAFESGAGFAARVSGNVLAEGQMKKAQNALNAIDQYHQEEGLVTEALKEQSALFEQEANLTTRALPYTPSPTSVVPEAAVQGTVEAEAAAADRTARIERAASSLIDAKPTETIIAQRSDNGFRIVDESGRVYASGLRDTSEVNSALQRFSETYKTAEQAQPAVAKGKPSEATAQRGVTSTGPTPLEILAPEQADAVRRSRETVNTIREATGEPLLDIEAPITKAEAETYALDIPELQAPVAPAQQAEVASEGIQLTEEPETGYVPPRIVPASPEVTDRYKVEVQTPDGTYADAGTFSSDAAAQAASSDIQKRTAAPVRVTPVQSTGRPTSVAADLLAERNARDQTGRPDETILDARRRMERTAGFRTPTETFAAAVKPINAALRKLLDTVGLKNTRIEVRPVIRNGEQIALGMFRPSSEQALMEIAVGHLDPNLTMDQAIKQLVPTVWHEIIHNTRSLFTPREWDTLVSYAARNQFVDSNNKKRDFTYLQEASVRYASTYDPKKLMADPAEMEVILDIANRYNVDPEKASEIRQLELISEESVAEMSRAWAQDHANIVGKPASLIRRIAKFMFGLSKALNDNGIDDVTKIFAGLESGDLIAQRGQPSPRGVARQSLRGPENVMGNDVFRNPSRAQIKALLGRVQERARKFKRSDMVTEETSTLVTNPEWTSEVEDRARAINAKYENAYAEFTQAKDVLTLLANKVLTEAVDADPNRHAAQIEEYNRQYRIAAAELHDAEVEYAKLPNKRIIQKVMRTRPRGEGRFGGFGAYESYRDEASGVIGAYTDITNVTPYTDKGEVTPHLRWAEDAEGNLLVWDGYGLIHRDVRNHYGFDTGLPMGFIQNEEQVQSVFDGWKERRKARKAEEGMGRPALRPEYVTSRDGHSRIGEVFKNPIAAQSAAMFNEARRIEFEGFDQHADEMARTGKWTKEAADQAKARERERVNKAGVNFRYIVTRAGDMYVWPAWQLIHDDVAAYYNDIGAEWRDAGPIYGRDYGEKRLNENQLAQFISEGRRDRVAKMAADRFQLRPTYEPLPEKFNFPTDAVPTPSLALTNDGRYTGTPGGTEKWTRPQVDALIRKMVSYALDPLADYTKSMWWYEDAGHMINIISHGDMALRERLFRVTALMSANSQLGTNWAATVASAYDFERNARMTKGYGQFPNEGLKTLTRLMTSPTFDKTIPGISDKVMSFYRNLKDAADGTHLYDGEVTLDTWMHDAMGYRASNKRFMGPQYGFGKYVVQEAARQISDQLGINVLPRQVQAMIWTRMVNADAAKGKKNYIAKSINYDEYANRMAAVVMVEAEPSWLGKFSERITKAPMPLRIEFADESHRLTLDSDGTNLVAKKIGVPLYKEGSGFGTWEDSYNPNWHVFMIMPTDIERQVIEGRKSEETKKAAQRIVADWKEQYPDWDSAVSVTGYGEKQRDIARRSKLNIDLADLSTMIYAYIYRQKVVGWHRINSKLRVGDSHAAVVMRVLDGEVDGEAVHKHLMGIKEFENREIGFSLVTALDGEKEFRFIDFSDASNDRIKVSQQIRAIENNSSLTKAEKEAQKKPLMKEQAKLLKIDRAFKKDVADALKKYQTNAHVTIEPSRADGKATFIDWSNGDESYIIAAIEEKAGKEVADWVRDRRAAFESVVQNYEDRLNSLEGTTEERVDRYSILPDNQAPKNTVRAYKLLIRDEQGELHSKFGNVQDVLPIGKWLKAETITKFRGINPKQRPGWHTTVLPYAPHIGERAENNRTVAYRAPNQVWAEVELGADREWQSKLNDMGELGVVPEGGNYTYSRGKDARRNWRVGGEMRILRVLSDAEVKAINDQAGVADLPRRGGVDRYSIAGIESKTADLAALERAQAMEKNAKSRYEIFASTGWWRGIDEKWRYEISDEGVTLNGDIDRALGGERLGDVFHHPALFAAYPHLADLVFYPHEYDAQTNPLLGQYNPDTNKINLASEASFPQDAIAVGESRLGTLLHELTHAVQDTEGFAQGGSTDLMNDIVSSYIDSKLPLYKQMVTLVEGIEVLKDENAVKKAIVSRFKADPDYVDGLIDFWKKTGAQPSQYFRKMIDDFAHMILDENPMIAYRRLAGEAEAGNVSRRSGMTAEQRREIPFWKTMEPPEPSQIVVLSHGDEGMTVGFGRPSLRPSVPTVKMYHGTTANKIDSIRSKGLVYGLKGLDAVYLSTSFTGARGWAESVGDFGEKRIVIEVNVPEDIANNMGHDYRSMSSDTDFKHYENIPQEWISGYYIVTNKYDKVIDSNGKSKFVWAGYDYGDLIPLHHDPVTIVKPSDRMAVRPGSPSSNYVVPPLSQQNAAGRVIEIRYGAVADMIGNILGKPFRSQETRGYLQSKVDSFVYHMQDKMLPLGRYIDAYREAGGTIPEWMDTVLMHVEFSGRTGARLQDQVGALYKPLFESVRELGYTADDVESLASISDTVRKVVENYDDPRLAAAEAYVLALHAPERNAEMQRRNANNDRGLQTGSGMSDEDARRVVDWFRRRSDFGNIEDVARRQQDIVKNTNQIRTENGLSPDYAELGMRQYDHYAPLRGWVEEDMDTDNDNVEHARAGRGFSLMNREDPHAIGRESVAANLLAHTVLQNEEAIIRAEKNRVANSFVDLVRTLNDPALGEIIEETPIKYVYSNGVVKKVANTNWRSAPGVLVAKRGGNEIAVRINDKRVARAMSGITGLNEDSKNTLLNASALAVRLMSQLATGWNPAFWVPNLTRDVQQAGINLTANEIEGASAAMVKNIWPAMKALHGIIRGGDNTSEWARLYNEMRRGGGTTEFYGLRTLDDQISNLNSTLQNIKPGSLAQARKAASGIINFIEDYNRIFENATRLSIYKALLDAGVTKDSALYAAKSTTVDFNRGGIDKSMINSLYMFFNASIQGSFAALSAMARSPKVRRIVAGIVVAGALNDLIQSTLSPRGDDDEPLYDSIPLWRLEHNFILMDPTGMSKSGYIAIPQPYGFGAFWNMGRAISRAMRGKSSVMEMLQSGLFGFADQFNPLSGTNSLANFAAPTLLDPIVDLYANKDYAGRSIYPEPPPYGISKPASQLYWTNTFPPYVKVADWLSRLSGGQGMIPGYFEVSPNQIGFIAEYFTSGLGMFVRRSANLGLDGIKALQGDLEDFSPNDIPIARRFIGNVGDREEFEKFLENSRPILAIAEERRQAAKEGDIQRLKAVQERYPEELKLSGRVKAIDRARNNLASRIRKIRTNPHLSDTAKRAMIDRLKKRMNDLVNEGNVAIARGT